MKTLISEDIKKSVLISKTFDFLWDGIKIRTEEDQKYVCNALTLAYCKLSNPDTNVIYSELSYRQLQTFYKSIKAQEIKSDIKKYMENYDVFESYFDAKHNSTFSLVEYQQGRALMLQTLLKSYLEEEKNEKI